MSRQKFATNPESAYYYKHIQHKRAMKRVQGYLYLIEAVGFLTFVSTMGIVYAPHNSVSFTIILFLICFGIFLLVTGILAIKRGYQPITHEEIADRRSTERKQLFQYAQGAIPWRYRLPTTVMEMLVSLFFLSVGAIALVLAVIQQASFGALYYAPYLLAGAYFLFDAFKRVKTAGLLALLSSQELAGRLELGELTEGQ